MEGFSLGIIIFPHHHIVTLFHHQQSAFPVKNRSWVAGRAEHCRDAVATGRQLHRTARHTQSRWAGLAGVGGTDLLASLQVFSNQAGLTHFFLKIRNLERGDFYLKRLLVLQSNLVLLAAFGHDAEHASLRTDFRGGAWSGGEGFLWLLWLWFRLIGQREAAADACGKPFVADTQCGRSHAVRADVRSCFRG